MADRNEKGQFVSGNKFAFKKGTAPIFLPGELSKIWKDLETVVRTNQIENTRKFKHMTFSMDPASYNSKSISKILALSKITSDKETRSAMYEVGQFIVENVIPRMFEEQGNSEGPWQELAESTKRWRRSKGWSEDMILVASGALFDEATSENAITEYHGGKNPRVTVGGQNFTGGSPGREGNNIYKYYVHMAGGSPSNVPARPFMPQTEDDFTEYEKEEIKEIFHEHIRNIIG